MAAPAKKDLARVAILKYKDLTETTRFGYMPASLTEAIDVSLQKKFEYVREDPAATMSARAMANAIRPTNSRGAAAVGFL
ncbi:MAG: hypothetical protein JSR44_03385 [Spirochaetes bacterium]|nr:hypothetical protein [Spirochaetota bacterium]